MKAPFRRIERDDEQRKRKWKSLGLGLFVATAATTIALGPLVPSRPSVVMLTVISGSILTGAVVGWRLRERKASMGGMVSLLFAFPLAGFFIGFPQSAGLAWIVFLFISVPFAAMGGTLGYRLTQAGHRWIPPALISVTTVTVLLALISRVQVHTKIQSFEKRSRPQFTQFIARHFVDGAGSWKWNARWQKGIWRGDYFYLETDREDWKADAFCTDTSPSHLVLFRAQYSSRRSVSSDDESEARVRLISLGLREELVRHPRRHESYWEFGPAESLRAFISFRSGAVAIRFDGRDKAGKSETVIALRRHFDGHILKYCTIRQWPAGQRAHVF